MAVPTQTVLWPTPKAGFTPLQGWEVLSVSGNDRVDFLKGLLTNAIRKLSVGDGNLTLYLTVKGRIEGEALLSKQESEILILSPPGYGQKLYNFLDRYHIMEDVSLTLTEHIQPILCIGHALDDALQSWESSLPDMGKGVQLNGPGASSDSSVWATRYPLCQPLEALVLWAPSEQATEWCDALENKGWTRLSAEEFTSLRAAFPWFDTQHDLEGILVHEARLEETHVDFAKGCFVGQEVVARTQHRGRANKHLHTLQSMESLPSGTSIQDELGKEAGQTVSHWQLSDDVHVVRALLKHKVLEDATALQAVVDDRCVPVQRVEFSPSNNPK